MEIDGNTEIQIRTDKELRSQEHPGTRYRLLLGACQDGTAKIQPLKPLSPFASWSPKQPG